MKRHIPVLGTTISVKTDTERGTSQLISTDGEMLCQYDEAGISDAIVRAIMVGYYQGVAEGNRAAKAAAANMEAGGR